MTVELVRCTQVNRAAAAEGVSAAGVDIISNGSLAAAAAGCGFSAASSMNPVAAASSSLAAAAVVASAAAMEEDGEAALLPEGSPEEEEEQALLLAVASGEAVNSSSRAGYLMEPETQTALSPLCDGDSAGSAAAAAVDSSCDFYLEDKTTAVCGVPSALASSASSQASCRTAAAAVGVDCPVAAETCLEREGGGAAAAVAREAGAAAEEKEVLPACATAPSAAASSTSIRGDRALEWTMYAESAYEYQHDAALVGKWESRGAAALGGSSRSVSSSEQQQQQLTGAAAEDKYWKHRQEVYGREGLRRSVAAVLLCHRQEYPHLLLMYYRPSNRHRLLTFKYRSWEKPAAVLQRKLEKYVALHPAAAAAAEPHKWVSPALQQQQHGAEAGSSSSSSTPHVTAAAAAKRITVGEFLGEWWRSEFNDEPLPYLPPHVSRPKERIRLYQVLLPPSCSFHLAPGFVLTALPLFDVYSRAYGVGLSGIPVLLCRFRMRLMRPCSLKEQQQLRREQQQEQLTKEEAFTLLQQEEEAAAAPSADRTAREDWPDDTEEDAAAAAAAAEMRERSAAASAAAGGELLQQQLAAAAATADDDEVKDDVLPPELAALAAAEQEEDL